jgi:UPF0716 family protein affecting phage T7 exclusion
MKAHLLSREVLPFSLALGGLAAAALLVDAVLHLADAVWIGRYLGIPGTLLIIASFGYSLRKRGLITSGRPQALLRAHEGLAWLGALLVLVHAGVHFNSILGWLAVWAMLVNVGSGLTGRFLLRRARERMEHARQHLRDDGLTPEQAEDRMYWDGLTFDMVEQWRAVHFPITLAFGVLALAHIIAIFMFWNWR